MGGVTGNGGRGRVVPAGAMRSAPDGRRRSRAAGVLLFRSAFLLLYNITLCNKTLQKIADDCRNKPPRLLACSARLLVCSADRVTVCPGAAGRLAALVALVVLLSVPFVFLYFSIFVYMYSEKVTSFPAAYKRDRQHIKITAVFLTAL